MKTVITFLSGAVFGIAAIVGGTWLWFQISTWLPYKRPDLQLVIQIEQQAGKTRPFIGPADMPGAPRGQNRLNISEFNRWYVEGENEKGTKVVWGIWRTASEKSPPGIELGHRRLPPDFTVLLGGGCSVVHLTYDVGKAALEEFTCNAPE